MPSKRPSQSQAICLSESTVKNVSKGIGHELYLEEDRESENQLLYWVGRSEFFKQKLSCHRILFLNSGFMATKKATKKNTVAKKKKPETRKITSKKMISGKSSQSATWNKKGIYALSIFIVVVVCVSALGMISSSNSGGILDKFKNFHILKSLGFGNKNNLSGTFYCNSEIFTSVNFQDGIMHVNLMGLTQTGTYTIKGNQIYTKGNKGDGFATIIDSNTITTIGEIHGQNQNITCLKK